MSAYLQLARPPQWVKNVFVLAGLLFGGTELLGRGAFLPAAGIAALAFASFCLASSACYALNDLLDRSEDRLHPVKKNRPVASGRVTPFGAGTFSLALAVVAVAAALFVGRSFAALLVTYLVLTTVYSLAIKKMIILDVIAISVGFVLRAWAGAVAVDVPVSPWLIVCTFTLCLFLGFGKRRCELAVLGNNKHAKEHRQTLEQYSERLLGHLISVSAGITVITFMLYTMDEQTQSKFGTNYLLYTVPLVIYGVFRYAMLIESGQRTGPTDILLKDRPFSVVIMIWLILAIAIIYRGRELSNWFQPDPSESTAARVRDGIGGWFSAGAPSATHRAEAPAFTPGAVILSAAKNLHPPLHPDATPLPNAPEHPNAKQRRCGRLGDGDWGQGDRKAGRGRVTGRRNDGVPQPETTPDLKRAAQVHNQLRVERAAARIVEPGDRRTFQREKVCQRGPVLKSDELRIDSPQISKVKTYINYGINGGSLDQRKTSMTGEICAN